MSDFFIQDQENKFKQNNNTNIQTTTPQAISVPLTSIL